MACKRCGKPKSSHWIANFADGPQVSGPIFICDTALYLDAEAELDTLVMTTRVLNTGFGVTPDGEPTTEERKS